MLWNCAKIVAGKDHPPTLLHMGVNAATSRVNSEYLLHSENKECHVDVYVLRHEVHPLVACSTCVPLTVVTPWNLITAKFLLDLTLSEKVNRVCI
jgi:hypothetical protein